MLIALSPDVAHAWGSRTHEIINRKAAEVLTGEAGDVWGPFGPALGMHASDADHRKGSDPDERPRHFIDIDAFEPHPFSGVPRTMEGMVRKYGREEASKWGVAPWAIGECYRMLVLSLERGDWGSAGAWASDLGHYVADTHQPLHCTVNYDGQTTGHDGVHLRFEIHMMDRHFDEASITVPDEYPPRNANVVEFCFDWITEAYPGLDGILAGEEVARAVDPGHGDAYYRALWDSTADLATRQVIRAVRDLSDLYRAAWEEAGRPTPPEAVPAFLALPVDVLDPPPPPPERSPFRLLVLVGGLLLSVLVASSL